MVFIICYYDQEKMKNLKNQNKDDLQVMTSILNQHEVIVKYVCRKRLWNKKGDKIIQEI